MYGEANALYWNSFESQNYTHLTLLKHQNTKTALKSSQKIIGFWHFLKIFGPSEKKLLVTVLLDHPVHGWQETNLSLEKSTLQC